MTAFEFTDEQRQTAGEALLVYIFRALDKPKGESYFHTRLLDVLVKTAKASVQAAQGLAWANGTSFLKQFDNRCRLDDHPHAPPSAVSDVFSKNESYAFLTKAGIDRVRAMPSRKRRQLEVLAAAFFPDHEAIRGPGKNYSGAHVVPDARGFLSGDGTRRVDRDDVEDTADQAQPVLDSLTSELESVFADPEHDAQERDKVAKEIEDVLLGRLELEQPLISAEFMLRVLQRSLARIGTAVESNVVDGLIERAIALLATILQVPNAA